MMRRCLLLLLPLAILPGCSGDSAKSEKSKVSSTTGSVSASTPTARRKFNELMKLVAADGLDWNTHYEAATTAEAKTALERDRPTARHAEKFLKLAQTSDDPVVTQQALSFAMTNGPGSVADSAGALLLDAIAKSTDPEDKESNLELALSVLNSTDGDTQARAANQLMADAGSLDTEESIEIVNQVLRSGASDEILKDITNRVLAIASGQQAEAGIGLCLASIAERSQDATKVDAAMRLLISKPANRTALLGLLKGLSQRPSQQAEDRLKSVCESLEGPILAQALLAFSEYNKTVSDLRNQFDGKPERVPPSYSERQRRYLAGTGDGLTTTVEKLMTAFVDSNRENKDLRPAVAQIASDLFVLQNLSVGKQAPEIAATDLDGTAFKLSDYRGKIVFLDFWGDW